MSFQDYLMGLPAEDARFAAISLLNEVYGLDGSRDRYIAFAFDVTPAQARILACLLAHPGRIMSKDVLLTACSLRPGCADEPEIKIVDVQICKLRARLKRRAPSVAAHLETVWGQGYRLQPEGAIEINARLNEVDCEALRVSTPVDLPEIGARLMSKEGARWSQQEDADLLRMYDRGDHPQIIAYEMGRSERAVTERVIRLSGKQ